MVLHLPLIIPDHCGFRVGSETRPWKPGKAWVFDDTIEHEAWNDSDQLRVIMIADIWNPYLTDYEREMYAAVLGAEDEFHNEAVAYSESI
jgi:aspartyl/asparaginyl beta-hydroxylase (cupin superfamily)